ncbi:MAG: hypothetical protein ACLQNE_39290 [Thermoguttaceae bacterium]
MPDEMTRRKFIGQSAKTLVVGSGIAGETGGDEIPGASPRPNLPTASPGGPSSAAAFALSKPALADCQLAFRIGLARQRTASYPCDSMDFILMDLERPEGRSRHAHWCTGDLTGRLLEFLSCSEGIDGRSDPRLKGLFERILKQRRPSGLFGRLAPSPTGGVPESDPTNGANRLFCGLVRYFELTGDSRAIEAAEGVAKRLLSVEDAWIARLKASAGRFIEAWVTEPFARIYGVTKDPRNLDFCALIRDHLGTCEAPCHAHGFMSTLRGLQTAALVTGDKGWNEKPELNRRLIAEKRFEMPDGCTPEAFPGNYRNEGCSIADWLMLNLNAGLLAGDDAAYEKAERIFWNALAFNQWIHGSFGHRGLMANGYGMQCFEEAWWCCVHNAGLAMSEYARHVVTFRSGAIRVNFLVPGVFSLPLPGAKTARVKIVTRWPAAAEATIEAEGVPAGLAVKLRIPGCVARPVVKEHCSGERVRLMLQGNIGHRIEECHPGVLLTFGPLILAPSTYGWNLSRPQTAADAAVPAGYIPQSLPIGTPFIRLPDKPDTDGFVHFPPIPLPEWSYFDEGPGARCWVEGAAAAVPLKFPGNEIKTLRFTPLCSNTSNLTLCETPLVFRSAAT